MHSSAPVPLSTSLRAAARAIPPSVLQCLSEIERAGAAAWLVGPPLHDLLCGRPPIAWEVQTGLSNPALLARYPKAVVTASHRRRVTLPSADGPIDVVALANPGALETQLGQRTFTLFALAYRPATKEWRDPHGGVEHALAGRLATVGPAGPRLRADPIASLRALRLMAQQRLELDAELEKSLAETAQSLSSCKPFLIREELIGMLRAPRPGAALKRLRNTGIEAVLAPGTRADSAAVIDLLSASLPLRLTAWLRDARADSILARLRFGRDPIVAVLRRLKWHPLDVNAVGRRSERIVGRLTRHELEDLLALRRAELQLDASPRSQSAFERLATRLRELHDFKTALRPELAVDGRMVMAALGCAAGPRVGRALRFLADCVRRDPQCNQPAELTQRLHQWSKENPA